MSLYFVHGAIYARSVIRDNVPAYLGWALWQASPFIIILINSLVYNNVVKMKQIEAVKKWIAIVFLFFSILLYFRVALEIVVGHPDVGPAVSPDYKQPSWAFLVAPLYLSIIAVFFVLLEWVIGALQIYRSRQARQS